MKAEIAWCMRNTKVDRSLSREELHPQQVTVQSDRPVRKVSKSGMVTMATTVLKKKLENINAH